RRVPRHSTEAQRLWRRGLARFARFLAQELPQIRVIIHDARCATARLDAEGRGRPMPESGPFWPDAPVSLADQNALFGAYVAELREALPDAVCLRAPAELTLADERHPWGLAPFHYVEDYY